jgi:hypothetical protein
VQISRIIAAFALALSLGALAAAPASAATVDEVGLSSDGVTWQRSLEAPLFAEPRLWVPGDAEVRTFWLRNQAGDAGALSLAVESSDPHGLLPSDDILIEARVNGEAWVAMADPQAREPQTLLDDRLTPGDVVRVDVRVTALWDAPNRSQRTVLPLDLRVTLSDAAASPGRPGGEDQAASGDPGGDLAATGAIVMYGALWLAAAALGGGLALLLGRRRGADEEAHRGEA